ncbi:hypothetical protein Taro_001732 [Colocasia esculenta]|uniref:Uncharacterized protein n=1 Tax=Colocasia esculenta TaxID=4460 RepID=A0A843TLM9_COLES|nr:hypothetical protein [Colocasia esculenta]
MATKVSPSVTERREATSRVPYRKGKACPGAHANTQTGHGNTPGKHKHCRAPTGRCDTIAAGKGTATIALMRRGNAS